MSQRVLNACSLRSGLRFDGLAIISLHQTQT